MGHDGAMKASDCRIRFIRDTSIVRLLLVALVPTLVTTACAAAERRLPASVHQTPPITPTPTASPTPTPFVTIDAPRGGTSTRERTARVRGRFTAAPRGGHALVTVNVNRRRVVLYPSGSRFTVRVVLELGRNQISAVAEIYRSDDDDEPEAIATSPPVGLTRKRGPDTGRLDLATGLWVAESHRDVYWLCGEADGCLAEPFCVRVAARRVDCPVKSRFQPRKPVVCGVVISVQLRGQRVYYYSYSCAGGWQPNRRVFVRPAIQRTGRRYRVDEKDAPWLEDEINDRNRYGIPRLDVVRDLFIP